MKNVRKLTEGALFLAIFAVLLLITLYLPVLGLVVNLFLSLPFILFAAKNDRKSSFVFLVASILISLIVGTVLAIPLAITYGLTGIVIGDFIREKKSRVAVFISGALVFLISLVIQYAATVALFEIDFVKESILIFKESITMSVELLKNLGQSPNEKLIEQLEASVVMMESLIPSLFVMSSFLIVFLIQLVSFPIIKRFGVEITGWKPFRELQLPKSLLWYYLFTLIGSLIINPEEGSFIFLAIVNLSFVLQFFMIVQGLSFVYYFSYIKSFPKAIPIIFTVLMFFIPIVLYIVRILGIIDLGFDLRKRIGQKK